MVDCLMSKSYAARRLWPIVLLRVNTGLFSMEQIMTLSGL
jgi:hypothetical protein